MTSQALTSHALPTSTRPTSLVSRLLATDAGLAAPLLRFFLALAMFPHGAQKLLGWFGGYGLEGTLGFMTEQIGLPWIVALSVVLLEFFGPLLLLAGLGTRLVGAAFAAIMVGAIGSVHMSHGFFMNWSGQAAGEGFEYHLLVIALGLTLMITGAGRWSLDGKLTR